MVKGKSKKEALKREKALLQAAAEQEALQEVSKSSMPKQERSKVIKKTAKTAKSGTLTPVVGKKQNEKIVQVSMIRNASADHSSFKLSF